MQDKNIEIYSTDDELISRVAEKYIRNLKIYKYMTSISKNVYIDKLHENVNKYNNAYHSTTKIKLIDVKVYILIIESDDKCDDPEFEVGDNVRISKYKSIFAKDYTTRSSEETFIIKKN